MNRFQEFLMDKPSLKSPRCVFCGRPKGSDHHVVPRSAGGTKGPTVSVCGSGNESGCHGLLHAHKLHIWWDPTANLWVYLYTPQPTKFQTALGTDGWKPVQLRSIQ